MRFPMAEGTGLPKSFHDGFRPICAKSHLLPQLNTHNSTRFDSLWVRGDELLAFLPCSRATAADELQSSECGEG
jgi:hypothetical protein